MDLQTLGSVGEFVGGVAVIASLLYLALQIRQNTTSLRETIARQTHDANARLTLLPVERPEVSEMLLRGSQNLDSLDAAESFRFHMYLMTGFLHYQDTYSHMSRSLIDRHLWTTHESHMFEFLASPGVNAWWSRNRHRFSSDFVDFIEAHRSSEG